MVDSMLAGTLGLLGGGQKVYGSGHVTVGTWARECYLIVRLIQSPGISTLLLLRLKLDAYEEKKI